MVCICSGVTGPQRNSYQEVVLVTILSHAAAEHAEEPLPDSANNF